jgi:hypothetical protein
VIRQLSSGLSGGGPLKLCHPFARRNVLLFTTKFMWPAALRRWGVGTDYTEGYLSAYSGKTGQQSTELRLVALRLPDLW